MMEKKQHREIKSLHYM